MTARTFTPAQFAAEFPRAAGHDDAIRYVAVDCHPQAVPSEREIAASACGLDEVAVLVGRTNRSGTKCVARYAIVAGNVAGAF